MINKNPQIFVSQKNVILITSIGRTGTEFFSKFFANILENSTSLHEPDIAPFIANNRLREFSQRVRRAGLWRMVFLKSLGGWSLVRLSDKKFLGKISVSRAARSLYYQRADFINKQPGKIYAEANIGYYGLIDVTPHVFPNHRLIYIVRNGQDWVTSAMNWGEIYGKSGIRKIFAHKWPRAKDFPFDPLAGQWEFMSKFEQLCWLWNALNEYALIQIPENPYARMFRFEDFFVSKGKYEHLAGLLSFITELPDIDRSKLGNPDGWLERRTHQSKRSFTEKQMWTQEQKKQFEKICGSLMSKLGYEF